jgi:flavorubredoxin
MQAVSVADRVHWVGADDPTRTSFDALIPLDQGTSYNAWLVQGKDHTVLLDTVEPAFSSALFQRLARLGVTRIDYVVLHHAEQDHSGSLPEVLARFPEAVALASPKCVKMLGDLMDLPEGRLRAVADDEELDLGGRTLRFIHAPWVHWPETMMTLLIDDGVLFSCDLFGAHKAFDTGRGGWEASEAAARLYHATIMLPLATHVRKRLIQVEALDVRAIAPSHGPFYPEPAPVLAANRRWSSGEVEPRALVAYVSMHGSTAEMAHLLAEALTARGVPTTTIDLARAGLGELAVAVSSVASLLLGAPNVLNHAHPVMQGTLFSLGLLRPPVRHVGLFGSFGWSDKPLARMTEPITHLKAELLEPVFVRGIPREPERARLDALAAAVAERHERLARTSSS